MTDELDDALPPTISLVIPPRTLAQVRATERIVSRNIEIFRQHEPAFRQLRSNLELLVEAINVADVGRRIIEFQSNSLGFAHNLRHISQTARPLDLYMHAHTYVR